MTRVVVYGGPSTAITRLGTVTVAGAWPRPRVALRLADGTPAAESEPERLRLTAVFVNGDPTDVALHSDDPRLFGCPEFAWD